MHIFHKVLVANRGEIAARVIRTARALGYETVAVHSTPDADSLAVALADEAVHIGPAPAAQSYLNVEALLEAAKRTGADAIHPGYGFLSENADFARACEAAGIVFIGPPASAIDAMGDKAQAKTMMQAAGVPTVPGYQGSQEPEVLAAEAAKIGYPVLLKASAGGGGRGMRRVDAPLQLAAAIESASSEARNAFGNSELLLEKLIEHARHVEIQVFADKLGNVIHLGERDCSAQRRHQKIIEESPCTVVEAGLRARMGEAAVAAARAIGYVGAGTVEFLLAGDGSFYFLEMNTRLQVEHPVTEMVTGLDLVQWQLEVAAGRPLKLTQEQVRLSGHAIEVRLYAEDPAAGFLPQTGEILAWLPAEHPGLRVDHGLLVGTGQKQQIGSAYDPMVAKLITHGATREEARRRMLLGLRDSVLLGPTHNKQFLLELLRHTVFMHGQVTTDFIESEAGQSLVAPTPAAGPDVVALAAVLWVEARRDPEHVRPAFVFAWHSANHSSTTIELCCAEQRTVVRLHAEDRGGKPSWKVEQPGASAVSITLLADDGVRVRYVQDGHRKTAHRAWTADGELLLEVGEITRTFVEHRPHERGATSTDGADGIIRAPTMGRVLALFVAAGDRVEPGQRLATLEAMKIESTITTPIAGTVAEVRAAVGDQVEKRQNLMTINPNEPA